MDDDIIADRQVFVLQHEQTDIAFDALGLAAGVEAVDLFDLHRDTETHVLLPCRFGGDDKKVESMRTTLILGIGNNLLSDEGIGVHVIRYPRGTPCRHARP
jgi:hypothetical protein